MQDAGYWELESGMQHVTPNTVGNLEIETKAGPHISPPIASLLLETTTLCSRRLSGPSSDLVCRQFCSPTISGATSVPPTVMTELLLPLPVPRTNIQRLSSTIYSE
jgi:hypothetical protein